MKPDEQPGILLILNVSVAVVFLASKSFNPINFISLFGLFQAEDVTVFRERRRARGMIAREL